MNLFDIWLISIVILVGANILLVAVLFNKISELKTEKKEKRWLRKAHEIDMQFMNEQKRAKS